MSTGGGATCLYGKKPSDFAYTATPTPTAAGADDLMDFAVMHSALLNCGFDESETTNLYELLAGLLHLGNVRIDTFITRFM